MMRFLGVKENFESYAQFCVGDSNVIYAFSRYLNTKRMNEWKSKDNFFRERCSKSLSNQQNKRHNGLESNFLSSSYYRVYLMVMQKRLVHIV